MRVAYANAKRKLSMTVTVVISTGFFLLSDRRSRGHLPSLSQQKTSGAEPEVFCTRRWCELVYSRDTKDNRIIIIT